MITSENISKRNILKDINFSTPKDSITGIIGPNGAGKSTLIKILTGFEFSDSGTIYIDGQKIEKFGQIKNRISYMPENMTLYPDYFVDEFIDFYEKAIDYRDEKLLITLGLKNVFDKKIKYLSKGWHQRVKLYTALCNKKDIVILDEPFEGFDPLQMREIKNIIFSQNGNNRQFILSIHQLSYAKKICNYFIFLNQGRLVAQGSLAYLSAKYQVKNQDLEEILLRSI